MVDLKLVKNSPKYWEFIRRLRNMDGVCQGFIQQEEITEIEQATYMLEHNNDFWLCLVIKQTDFHKETVQRPFQSLRYPEAICSILLLQV